MKASSLFDLYMLVYTVYYEVWFTFSTSTGLRKIVFYPSYSGPMQLINSLYKLGIFSFAVAGLVLSILVALITGIIPLGQHTAHKGL